MGVSGGAEGPGGAVLRVIGAEGKPYKIVWGPFSSSELGMVDDGRAHKDHTVPPEAGDSSEGFNVVVEKVVADGGKARIASVQEWGGDLRAVLFVDGEYATCAPATASVARLYWHPDDGLGGPITRATCGSYRYTRFLPD